MPDGSIRRLRWNSKQQEFLIAAETGECLTAAMIGSNQYGKSVAAGADAVATISGIPISQWDKLPDELLSTHLGQPKQMWGVTPTFTSSRLGQQFQFHDRLPAAWIRRGVYEPDTGYGNKMVVLHNGGQCEFKSVDQGLDAFETVPLDKIWWDEIQDIPHSFFSKALARLVAKGGRQTVTGLPNAAWVVDLFIKKQILIGEEEGSAAASVHTVRGTMYDNLAMSESSIAEIGSHMTEEERRLRVLGEIVVMEGLVYSEFGEHNIVAPFPVRFDWPSWDDGYAPNDSGWVRRNLPWTPYEFIDPGYRNPYAVGFCGMNPDSELFLIDELYETGVGNDAMAAKIKEKRARLGYERPAMTVIDTAATQRREHTGVSTKAQLEALGIYTVAKRFDRQESTGKLRRWMRPAGFPNVRPRFFVFGTCRNFLREVRTHHVPPPEQITQQYLDDKETVVAAHNHLLDGLRYLVGHEPTYREPPRPRLPADGATEWEQRQGQTMDRRTRARVAEPRKVERHVLRISRRNVG